MEDAAGIALSHPCGVIALLGAGEVDKIKDDLIKSAASESD
jgi:hypothetical protein